MKLAIVGATGMVGREMLNVINEYKISCDTVYLAANRSVGETVEGLTVMSTEEVLATKPDAALFSAGGSVSEEWAPKFAAAGTTVIDNSSAWRMKADIKLIVPEINADTLTRDDKIIANPNCSTIQLVTALHPLHEAFELKRLLISTYQAVSGTGKAAVAQLQAERAGQTPAEQVYPYPIDGNCLPHCDVFVGEEGYTKEEMKLVNETRKILNAPDIAVSATAVRVPVEVGHSESVNAEFERPFTVEEVWELLVDAPGVKVMDEPSANIYPTVLQAKGKDDVLVGRIRRDLSHPQALNMWIVADNLRKGAASNAVQILQHLMRNELIG